MPIHSKNKGKKFELDVRAKAIEHGFDSCITSRLGSKALDDAKVDLMHTDPFYFQCKHVEKGLNPFNVLEEMPKDTNYNILAWKRNRKGVIYCIQEDDFWEIIDLMKKNGVI